MSSRLLITRERAATRSISELPPIVSGWPVRVLRPRTGNRMRLSVETGFVRLTWPERVSATVAVSFFEQHQAWLERTVRVYRQAEERAAASVLALCAAGRAADARAQADRFARRSPRSPLLARIAGSCAGPR